MIRFGRAKLVVAGVAALALVVGGFAVASNTGFKFVPNVAAGDFFNLSLPWNNQYTVVHELFNDMPGVSSIRRTNAGFTFTTWNAGTGPPSDYTIVDGTAYTVEASGGGISTAVIVGSHNPNLGLTLNAGEFRNISVPYHGTLGSASLLFNDMAAQLGAGVVTSLRRVNPGFTFTTWNAGTGPPSDFPIDLGAGVIVESTSAASYLYPHF